MDDDKLTSFVKAMKDESDQMVEGLLEAIERLSIGNPRFTKAERAMFNKFFHVVINQMAALMRSLQSLNQIRLKDKELQSKHDQFHDLVEQSNEQTHRILGAIKDLILHDRIDDAIELIDRLRSYKR